MTTLNAWILGVLLVLPSMPPMPQGRTEGRNQITVRARMQDVYFFQGTGAPDTCRSVLFLPGDGGWRGFAIVIAQTLASWGYDVYAWDTKQYLESFTGKTPLTEMEVMSDFRQVAEWIRRGCREPITLVGWSEGAGLCLLAAASEQNKSVLNGLVALGLTEENTLGWRWADYLSYLTNREPSEPSFKSMLYMAQVTPLPIWMLQSSGDQYVSVDASNRLFAAAREPKRYYLINASNHRFDGNHTELFRLMKEALESISLGRH